MDDQVDIDLITKKADEMFDRSWPGFIHAERRAVPDEATCDLTFPCGLTCTTNSSPIETELAYNEIFVRKEYVRSGIDLEEGDTVIDVGANVGIFTLFLLRNFRGLTIHAVEPIPVNFRLLERNVARYGGCELHLHNTALGSEPDGRIELLFYPRMTGNSTAYPETKRSQREALSSLFSEEELGVIYSTEGITVASTTFSSLLRKERIGEIALLKIDTEGSETDVLRGIEPGDWKRIRQAVIEVHDELKRLAVVREMLTSHGMRVTVDEQSRDPFGTVVITAKRG